MALSKSQRSLRSWTKQDWGTKSGKKSSETGERYLPKAARDSLTSAEYAATTAKKRKDTAAGKQHSKQPKRIAKKTRGARQFKFSGGGVELQSEINNIISTLKKQDINVVPYDRKNPSTAKQKFMDKWFETIGENKRAFILPTRLVGKEIDMNIPIEKYKDLDSFKNIVAEELKHVPHIRESKFKSLINISKDFAKEKINKIPQVVVWEVFGALPESKQSELFKKARDNPDFLFRKIVEKTDSLPTPRYETPGMLEHDTHAIPNEVILKQFGLIKQNRNPRQFKQIGGIVESNKINLNFNPLAELMLDSLLVERVQKNIGGRIARGIGDNISKFPELLDKITDKPVSDKAAKKIFNVENELKILKDLEKKKKRFDYNYLYDKRSQNYDAIYDRFGGDEDKIDNFIYEEFSDLDNAKLESLKTQIANVKNKALKKIQERLEVVIKNRTIPELDPIKGYISKEQIADAAANIEGNVFAQKNKAIILNLAKYIDSPGYNKFYESTYASRKLSPSKLEMVENLSTNLKPKSVTGEPFVGGGIERYMNPLEINETRRTFINPTMQLGDSQKPFFVNPEKLYRTLDKSTSGEDFLKLRMGTEQFSNEIRKFENVISFNTYKPSPIQIFIYPTGNGYIYEGNHRLMRALKMNEAEVPVKFHYLAGAERVEGPFSIRKLFTFTNEDKLGFKTTAEYQEYKDEINEQYLINNYTRKPVVYF